MKRSRLRAAALAGLALLAACGGTTRPSSTPLSVSGIPASLDDGWTVSSAGAEGLDAGRQIPDMVIAAIR
jgi:ABC-type glycerol-3-phosphate transport system substrate-binding protein